MTASPATSVVPASSAAAAPVTLDDLFASQAGAVWRFFAALSQVPRPSRQEEPIRAHLCAIAAAHGWESRRDAYGNLVFAVPGRGRLAQAPILGLQGHMDMVCEKNSEVQHDFTRDPIRLRIDGDWVLATGTTLGADNGVALALAMAAASADVPDRVPLELIFTTDEETGLNGASNLDVGIVKARTVLNLDAEEDGEFIIGCAGGADLTVDFPYLPDATAPASTTQSATGEIWSVHLRGLRGGHSGVNIHEGRGNAIRALCRLVASLRPAHPGVVLHTLDGGNKRNAIPREARVTISGVPENALRAAADTVLARLHATGEPAAALSIALVDPAAPTPVAAARRRLSHGVVDFIVGAPHDVIAMDPNFPTLVQTSNSIGVVETTDGGVRVYCHTRSSSESARRDTVEALRVLGETSGGRFTHHNDYPGWEPNPDSRLLRQGIAAYTRCFGVPPRVLGIHAGLESGIIGARLGTGELLAYGPTIHNAHSPDECLSITSLERTWRWLLVMVTESA